MARRPVLPVMAFLFGLCATAIVDADEHFEKPVRLEADGKVIDTGAQWGHSSPCLEDLDGDGLSDLIVGDFSGQFRVFTNVGSKSTPQFQANGYIQAGGEIAKVPIYCCVGGQPRFVDLNGDGIRDFISSSYDPGHCYFFEGLPNHKFAKMEELVDKDGTPVRSVRLPKQNYQAFGSFYMPVDWDADGDFDVLIGCFGGELKLRINEGDREKAAFAVDNQAVKAGGKPLKVSAHCCPLVADWDHDGLWDILTGSDDGSVSWFRNVGTASAPEFAEAATLVAKHEGHGYDIVSWKDDEPVPGIRSQIEVCDFNDDNKLDLLVGDFFTALEFKPTLTDKQKQEVQTIMKENVASEKPLADKMKAMREDFAKRYPGDKIYSDEADKEWSKAYKAFRESPDSKAQEEREAEYVKKMKPYLAGTHSEGDRSFDLAKPHGYVWLFTRK